MTLKDRLKDTCDYFGWDFPSLSNFDIQKLESIWKVEPVVEVKHIVKNVYKPMFVLTNPVDLLTELKTACETYGVTLEQVRSKSRKAEIICARVHFCRSVKSQNKRVKLIQLAALLNRRDHTDIHNYLFNSKANVPFEQFEPVKRRRKVKNYKAA